MLNTKNTKIRYLLLTAVFLLILPVKAVPESESPEVIFIVNRENPETTINPKDIRDIFLGDKSAWNDGSRIYFSLIRSGPVHNRFLSLYIDMSPKNFIRYWKRQILTGKATKLKPTNSEEEIVKYVAMNKGAIGYVSSTFPIEDVKKITVLK